MASGHADMSSSNISNKFSKEPDFTGIDKHKDCSCLSYSDNRFRWNGCLPSLKNFVECGVGLHGTWTLPGGSSRKFICSHTNLSITWYLRKRNTIILNGKTSSRLVDALRSVCSTSMNSNLAKEESLNNCDVPRELIVGEPEETARLADHSPGLKDSLNEKPNEVRSTSNKSLRGYESNCRCRSLAIDMEGVKLDLIIMQNKQKQIDTYIESHMLLEHKLREKDEVIQLKQNLLNEVELRKKLENDLTILVAGRNAEIEELNNTIASLQNKLELFDSRVARFLE